MSLKISTLIIATIQGAPHLADISKRTYLSHLTLLTTDFSRKTDCWAAIADHTFTIMALQARFKDKHASLNAYSAAVIACFRLIPTLKDSSPSAFNAWTVLMGDVRGALKARVLSSQPTVNQAPGWVSFEEIDAMRRSLQLGSPERLLLAMYTDIPARRNDYANLKIFSSQPPVGTRGNFIVLPNSSRSPVTLTLTSYKTDKHYKDVSEVLPDTLVEDIRAGLALYPRDVLFISPKFKREYKTTKAFSKWANETLSRLFHKPLTLTIMRHVYVSHLKFDEMTGQQRADIARRMGHSVETQGLYKWIK